MKEVVLLGVFSEIVELCERKAKKIGYGVDPNMRAVFSFPVLSSESELIETLGHSIGNYEYIVVPDSPKGRQKIIESLASKTDKMTFPSVIDDGVILSKTAKIGKGSVIMGGSLISSNSRIGDFVKMNFFARVHHDVEVGNYCTIAPGTTVLGRVKLGEGVYVGANATIMPGIEIGDGVIVGAGAVVTKDVEAGMTVKGIPAR
ncbi:acetyltransferase [Mesotoga sp.]|uniref:acetyltransferase n=1 Tax=Mesotoga sp. TaxID=2053577 RepID=UPI00345E79DB